jgi:hypothetical protein
LTLLAYQHLGVRKALGTHKCQKRPTTVSKETYYSVKRRPWVRTSVKRDLIEE